VKVLGEGELSVALTVEAASFSKSAREKIQAAGGSVRWLKGEPPAEEEAAPAEAAKPKRAAKAQKPAAQAAEEEASDGAGS
jgi:hypothetical protein